MAVTLPIDDELGNALDALVALEGAPREEVIRRAVLDRFDRFNRTVRIDGVLTQQLPRYNATFDRLA